MKVVSMERRCSLNPRGMPLSKFRKESRACQTYSSERWRAVTAVEMSLRGALRICRANCEETSKRGTAGTGSKEQRYCISPHIPPTSSILLRLIS